MRSLLRRLADAVTHSGPGYETSPRPDADLRATLTALVDRWAIQLADYNEQAAELRDGRAARHDARIRGTRLQHCIDDLLVALAEGRLPHDLVDGQPLLPRRGDDVAEWIKRRRDEFDEHVCEGRGIGDCDCLETGGTR